MATRENYLLTQAERQKRVFSDAFKRQKVKEIDQGVTTIAELSRAYQVRASNIRKWMYKYSTKYKKGVRLIVEMESETKKLLELQKRIADLERIVGQKQLLIDFQAKMIELAEEEYSIDIKKKSENEQSSTTGNTESNSPAV